MTGSGERAEGVWVYAVRYGDGSYHVGTTRGSLAERVAQHNEGAAGDAGGPPPATLVWSRRVRTLVDAVAAARYLETFRSRQA